MKNITMLALGLLVLPIVYANNTHYLLGIVNNSQHSESQNQLNYIFIDSNLMNIENGRKEEISIGSENYKDGMGITYNLLQTLNIPIRAELVVETKENNITNKDHGIYTQKFQYLTKKPPKIMLNAYYDFYNESNFRPYISLGFGAGVVQSHHQARFQDGNLLPSNILLNLLKNNNNSHLVYTFGLGSSYSITSHWTADIGAKYYYGGNMEVYYKKANNQASKKTLSNSIDLAFGMTYHF